MLLLIAFHKFLRIFSLYLILFSFLWLHNFIWLIFDFANSYFCLILPAVGFFLWMVQFSFLNSLTLKFVCFKKYMFYLLFMFLFSSRMVFSSSLSIFIMIFLNLFQVSCMSPFFKDQFLEIYFLPFLSKFKNVSLFHCMFHLTNLLPTYFSWLILNMISWLFMLFYFCIFCIVHSFNICDS